MRRGENGRHVRGGRWQYAHYANGTEANVRRNVGPRRVSLAPEKFWEL